MMAGRRLRIGVSDEKDETIDSSIPDADIYIWPLYIVKRICAKS
jgi:hypothetical protein